MFQVVDNPHLNAAGTLLGNHGPCIDTRIVVNGTGHVYVGPAEAAEIARLAKEAGWLNTLAGEDPQDARIRSLEQQLEEAQTKLRRFQDLARAT